MTLLFLTIIFAIIISFLMLKKPLFVALSSGILATIFLFQLGVYQIFQATTNFITNLDSINILLSMYLITYLQRMLESKKQIKLAEMDLSHLFNNKRVTIIGSSLVIGLLPSAAAMLLCADIVSHQTKSYLNKEEQAFLTSWFRHIPESSLPTYSSVLLMVNLSGIPISTFMLYMIIPMLTLFSIGYFRYLRKIPIQASQYVTTKEAKWKHAINFFKHLWSLLFIIVLIVVFKVAIVPAILLAIILSALVYRFSRKELLNFVSQAFELKLLINMAFVLYFKEFLTISGGLAELPKTLSLLPLPTYLLFVVLFFLGGIISGISGIIALGTPLAFAAIPNGGVSLLVLLMCAGHAASQLSPVHVCLTVVSEYYEIGLGRLIYKTLPASLAFLLLMIGYYHVLQLIN